MQQIITSRNRNVDHIKQEVSQYRIIAVIDNDTYIKDEQAVCKKNYGSIDKTENSSFISLASFEAKEEMEDTLLRWLRRIVGAEQAFSVVSNNFGFHPEGKVYLRILDASKLLNLKNHMQVLEPFIQSNNNKKVNWFKSAEIIIGHVDEAMQLEAAYHYAQQSSAERLLISHLCVQKIGDNDFRTICKLPLQP